MIKEEYVTYESAKLLKEAGFPQEGGYDCFFDKEDVRYSIPKQSQAMRWLREEKNLTIIFELFTPSEVAGTDINPGSYAVDIYCSQKGYHLFSIDEPLPFPTYEAAAEAGIKAACKYLIAKEATHDTTQENVP